MTNNLIKTTLAALAFVTLASSANVASAGVASIALGNVGAVSSQIGTVETAPTQVHYRYYGHSHRRHGYNSRRSHGRSYGGCRRIKQRYWDGYGYSYRWVSRCH